MPAIFNLGTAKGLLLTIFVFSIIIYFFNSAPTYTTPRHVPNPYFKSPTVQNKTAPENISFAHMTIFSTKNITLSSKIADAAKNGFNSTIVSALIGSNFTALHKNSSANTHLVSNNVSISNFSPTVESPVIENNNANSSLNSTEMPLCPEISTYLIGRVPIVKSPVPTVLELERDLKWLLPGGHWKPDGCRVLKKVAIIVPFRCRGEHLLIFLRHMHPFLRRQQLDYTIFIIEQDGDSSFNRAMLMNIGYKEALNISDFDCFIFHDIDLLPEDDRNIYSCPIQPRHMSVAIDIFNYKLPYSTIFGGVCAINKDHFQLLNGFSNSYWGWGGEDDDMHNRIRYKNLYVSRYPPTIARYTMLTHKKDTPNPNRYNVLKQGQKMFDKDGLNNLKYALVQKKQHLLYTWILASIEPPS